MDYSKLLNLKWKEVNIYGNSHYKAEEKGNTIEVIKGGVNFALYHNDNLINGDPVEIEILYNSIKERIDKKAYEELKIFVATL